MEITIGRIVSDRFEHRQVGPDFINPCCFGKDLAAWLRGELKPALGEGFFVGEPLQEDFGWCLTVRRGKACFNVLLPFVGSGPTEEPGEWDACVEHGSGLLWRLLGWVDKPGARRVADAVTEVLRASPDVELRTDA